MIFFSTHQYGSEHFAMFFAAIALPEAERLKQVCKILDIKSDTLQRYLSGKSTPPKSMVRLLFMESCYGQSAVSNHAHNGYVTERILNRSLSAQIERLQATIAALEAENDTLKRSIAAPMQDYAANSSRDRVI